MPIEPLDCLSALIVGLHFSKARYRLANSFNDILDQFSELPDFQIRSNSSNELAFRIKRFTVVLNQNALILKSHPSLGEKLVGYLPKKDSDAGPTVLLPTRIYDSQVDFALSEIGKTDPEKFRKSFLEESVEVIKTLDKIIISGLEAFRFIGVVEYYVIPLRHLEWEILEKFKTGAAVPEWENTEKITVNRYYLPTSEVGGDKRCFIFRLDRPDDPEPLDDTVATASFDFQIIPEKPKTIEDFHGPDGMIKSLSIGIQEVIRKSQFMKLKTFENKKRTFENKKRTFEKKKKTSGKGKKL